METRIAFFRHHRAMFDEYVGAVLAGKVASGSSGLAVTQVMLDNGLESVGRKDGCVVLTFSFMPTDAVPELIYSARGLAGVPEMYKSGKTEGQKLPYWKFVSIDEHWFYCEWDSDGKRDRKRDRKRVRTIFAVGGFRRRGEFLAGKASLLAHLVMGAV